MIRYSSLMIFFLASIFPALAQKTDTIKVSEILNIIPLTENASIHSSLEYYPTFGKVSSNGVIYINNNEAIIFDTPSNEQSSRQLLSWFEIQYPNVKIVGVIINHFHTDCLGGLSEFHKAGIKSYAHQYTLEELLSKKDTTNAPLIYFQDSLTLTVGGEEIIAKYFGEAHTRDNIATWIPSERLLFGGCMVKSLNATKGNLEDANVDAWPITIEKVKAAFPTAEIVFPGHGSAGGLELLDYTIKMFKADVNQND